MRSESTPKPGGRSIVPLAILALLIGGLGFVGINQIVTIKDMQQRLHEAEIVLAQQQEINAELVEANQELDKADRYLALLERQTHSWATGNMAQLNAERTLDHRFQGLGSRYAAVDEMISFLESENESLDSALTSAVAERSVLERKLESAEGERDHLKESRVRLQGSLASLEAEALEFRQAEKSIESLQAQITELTAELRELEGRREALLVRSLVAEIHCTGSMEPALTCLDSVTILTNFHPEDIVVGSIISFFEDGDKDSTPILHRVLERKVESGVHYYWPGGDAAEEPDGYWVPEDWIEGYVTEMHKDTHPENAELRDKVLGRKDAYHEAQSEYDAVVYEICGDIAAGTICYTTDEEEERLDSAYDVYLLAWCHYVSVLNRAELEGTGTARALPYECRGQV